MGRSEEAVAAERGPGARARPRRVVRGLGIAAVSLVALLAAGELGLRLARDRERAFEEGRIAQGRRWLSLVAQGMFEAVDDPVRRYALRPGASAVVDEWSFHVTRHRTRGEDFPRAKEQGERRILCLGDSFAFGMWCDDDRTVVEHLARMANEAEAEAGSGVRWRAVNLGVPGYHAGQQLRALEADGLALEPDVVVVYFNTNDIASEGFFYDADLGAIHADHLPVPGALKPILWESRLYGWLVRRVDRHYRSIPAHHLDPDVPWSHTRLENQRATRAALAGIARLCRERGVRVFAIHQPLMTWSGDARREGWRVLPLVEWAEGVFEDLGVPSLSLLGWMRNYADGVDRFPAPPTEGFLIERYFADERIQEFFAGGGVAPEAGELDFHLTGEGYEHVARLAYERMRAEGMLP